MTVIEMNLESSEFGQVDNYENFKLRIYANSSSMSAPLGMKALSQR